MKYDPVIHHRRSIRLQGYDYSRAGAYFVTICTQERQCLFGKIVDGEMRLNDLGRVVADSWEWLARQYDHAELDEWVIMPNHMHGIIVITDDCRGGSCRGRSCRGGSCKGGSCKGGSRTAPTMAQRKPVGRLIGAFKTVSTKRINELRQTPGVKLWQRNYWEHIVRDEPELQRIRQYIHNNPSQWEMDTLHPNHPEFGGAGRDGSCRGGSRTAPTMEIHEPAAPYGYGVNPNGAGWMA
ncbi:MAG: transposase [Thermodesulfobacteriota bacterium]